jgi:hypothetical protein
MANLINLTINDTGFLGLPSGTTDQRPGSPATGYVRFNTTLGIIEYYNGSYWIDQTSGKVAEGTTITSGLQLHLDAGKTTSYRGGKMWYDISGKGHHGIFYNSPTYSSIDGNGSIAFNGSTQYMTSNIKNTTLDGDPNFTVDFFVKRTTDFNVGAFWGIGGTGQGNSISGWTPTTNRIHIDVYDSTRLDSATDYPLNTYVHVAWVKSGTSISTSTVKCYVNGVEKGLTLTRSQTSGPQYNTSTSGVGVTLGRIVSNADGYYAPITMGVFRIYNTALSASEILQNYNAQKYRFGL